MIFAYLFAALLVAAYWQHREHDWLASGACFVVGVVVSCAVYYGPMYWQASDLQLLSGSVAEKKRVYDPETESYDCGKDSQGHTKTCTREIPRWRWDVVSDIDGDKFSEYTHQSIRAPEIYTNTQIGDPYTASKRFLNFQNVSEQTVMIDREAAEEYKGWLPEYPHVYAGFKVQRGFSNTPQVDQRELSRQLNVAQKRWGPMHGVNVIVIALREETDFKGFYYALKSKWKGGKKNDAVVVMRLDKEGRVINANSFTRSADNLTDPQGFNFSNLMHVNAVKLNRYDTAKYIEALDSAFQYFQREDLGRYDFLKDEYDPPYWLVALSLLAIVVIPSLTVNYILDRRNAYGRRHRKFGFI